LALADGREALGLLQVAAALSMEGFCANTTPLDERVVTARPAPGQATCAAGLRRLLAGSSAGSRRLQDPLSFRCVSQTHGSLWAALASEIAHSAAPVSLDVRAGADPVEDASTGAPLAAERLRGLLERLRLLTAVELVVAAQAVDMAGIESLGRGTGDAYAVVRELV